jgi:hypothetical protein
MELMLPILDGTCDAVTGQITLAPNLLRHWLTRRPLRRPPSRRISPRIVGR